MIMVCKTVNSLFRKGERHGPSVVSSAVVADAAEGFHAGFGNGPEICLPAVDAALSSLVLERQASAVIHVDVTLPVEVECDVIERDAQPASPRRRSSTRPISSSRRDPSLKPLS